MLELIPVPQLQAANKAVVITWWVSIFAIIIALLLIIISFVMFSKDNTSAGTGLLITGAILGSIAGFTFHYTNRSFDEIVYERAKQGPAGQVLKTIFGKDEETVKDCGCKGADDDKDNLLAESELDELDYLESSDEELQNPFDDEKKTK